MIILLDIDGVMVKAVAWKAPELLPDGFPAFTDVAIAALNMILDATGARIVLSTSHKHAFRLDEWQALFRTRGIVAPIDRLDNNVLHRSRKDELLFWISKNNPDAYVILDDDSSLNDLPSTIKKHWIATSSMIGLTGEHVVRAISLLASGPDAGSL